MIKENIQIFVVSATIIVALLIIADCAKHTGLA